MNYIIVNEKEYKALCTAGSCLILREGEALYTARLAEEKKRIPGSIFVLVGYAVGEGMREIAVLTDAAFC